MRGTSTSATGTGVNATNTGGGAGLRVVGRSDFSRSGVAAIVAGVSKVTVSVPGH